MPETRTKMVDPIQSGGVLKIHFVSANQLTLILILLRHILFTLCQLKLSTVLYLNSYIVSVQNAVQVVHMVETRNNIL